MFLLLLYFAGCDVAGARILASQLFRRFPAPDGIMIEVAGDKSIWKNAARLFDDA
jgi:hypothetical protein